jgi:hypothetical protein
MGLAVGVGLAAGVGPALGVGLAVGVRLAASEGEAEATGDAVVDVHPAAMKRTAIALAALTYCICFIMPL